MERPQTQETNSELLSTQLESIMQGANLVRLRESKDQNREMFCLKITDLKKWTSRENVENLLPFFGQAAMQVYSLRENTPEFDLNDPEIREKAIANFAENELGINDTTYVIAENGNLAAFLTGSEAVVDNQKVFNLGLSFVSPDQRGKGTGKVLYKAVFTEGDYEAILGCSATPAAIILRLNMGNEFGFTGFFAGYKNGVMGDKGTPKQQDLVEKFTEYVQKEYEETSIPLEDLPKNYVVVRADVEPIPPLTRENLHFKEGDHQAAVFYEDVLPTQAKFLEGKNKGTAYGVLINFRDDVLPE
jgi:hypothetical protein